MPHFLNAFHAKDSPTANKYSLLFYFFALPLSVFLLLFFLVCVFEESHQNCILTTVHL